MLSVTSSDKQINPPIISDFIKDQDPTTEETPALSNFNCGYITDVMEYIHMVLLYENYTKLSVITFAKMP